MEEILSTTSCFGCVGDMETSWCFGAAPVALPRKPWERSALG